MSFSSSVKKELGEIEINEHCKLVFEMALNNALPAGKIGSRCCKMAYLRGAFIASGAIVEPKKGYHMQFTMAGENYIKPFMRLFNYFKISPKIMRRKTSIYLYLKDADAISTVLNIIGAHKSLMYYENCRVDKEVSNEINRLANFETANTDKILNASAKHIAFIQKLQNEQGLSVLPKNLRNVAVLRLENPLLSLAELGKLLEPPVSKFALSRSLKKIELMSKGE